ncbi:MAG: HPr family phosphocarrier protein [Tissierellia bacterium]|nr:HPr family phosphocarrier protein [Tissierellia bacterium]
MREATVKLLNDEGLHARPAAIFVKTASKLSSDISIVYNGVSVNGKSIIGIMSLGAFNGEEITIQATGSDEEVAVKTLSKLVENNFGS